MVLIPPTQRVCVLRGRIVMLQQDPTYLYYKVTWPTNEHNVQSPTHIDDTEALLRHYFALHVNLEALYKQWSDADANFRRRAPAFGGVRMLSQDAWEALVCFICSSNNNIARISQMVSVGCVFGLGVTEPSAPSLTHTLLCQVQKLCLTYGRYINTIDGVAYHDFPPALALTAPTVEASLRSLGFGYRAKYIATTARTVALEHPSGWLDKLRNPLHPAYGSKTEDVDAEATYPDAHEALIDLHGVGPKVADCVCLMGLGWGGAIPVDTHVWQIATRDYKYGGSRASKTKTLTKAMYDGVGEFFRDLWGEYAGWAHSVLFTADLKSFSNEMRAVAEAAVDGDVKLDEVVKFEAAVETLAGTEAANSAGAASRVVREKRQTRVKRETRVKDEDEDETMDEGVKDEDEVMDEDVKDEDETLDEDTKLETNQGVHLQTAEAAAAAPSLSQVKSEETVDTREPIRPTRPHTAQKRDDAMPEADSQSQHAVKVEQGTPVKDEIKLEAPVPAIPATRKRTRRDYQNEQNNEPDIKAVTAAETKLVEVRLETFERQASLHTSPPADRRKRRLGFDSGNIAEADVKSGISTLTAVDGMDIDSKPKVEHDDSKTAIKAKTEDGGTTDAISGRRAGRTPRVRHFRAAKTEAKLEHEELNNTHLPEIKNEAKPEDQQDSKDGIAEEVHTPPVALRGFVANAIRPTSGTLKGRRR